MAGCGIGSLPSAAGLFGRHQVRIFAGIGDVNRLNVYGGVRAPVGEICRPGEPALLNDFVNTLDRRRYVERGVVHAGGDALATSLALLPGTSPRGTGKHRRGASADRGQQGFSADSNRCRRGNRHAGCGPWIECARSCRRGTIRPGEDGSACAAVKGMRIRTVSLEDGSRGSGRRVLN
jgi:hypothetical protein